MKRILFSMLMVFAVLLFPVAAEDLSIDYVDGYLDLLDDGDWIELYPGDVISSSDTIRLDEDSFADLLGRNKTLSLTEPGIYQVSKLLSNQAETTGLGLGSVVSGKLAIMLQNQTVETQSTVGGVRAAEAEGAPQIDWMESETMELIDEGKELLEEGNTEDAKSLFEEAWDLSMDEQEESQALYYLGYAFAAEGKAGQALKYLTMAEPDPYLENYHNYYLLTGNLLVNTFAFEKAVQWFDDYDASSAAYKAPNIEQMIYLLSGMSYKMTGETSQARSVLNQAVSLNSGSDTAAKAREVIDSL